MNCTTCKYEYRDKNYKGHLLCRKAWDGDQSVKIWIQNCVINSFGAVNKESDNCPGWDKK